MAAIDATAALVKNGAPDQSWPPIWLVVLIFILMGLIFSLVLLAYLIHVPLGRPHARFLPRILRALRKLCGQRNSHSYGQLSHHDDLEQCYSSSNIHYGYATHSIIFCCFQNKEERKNVTEETVKPLANGISSGPGSYELEVRRAFHSLRAGLKTRSSEEWLADRARLDEDTLTPSEESILKVSRLKPGRELAADALWHTDES
jgi:hypothetical protein